MHWLSLICQIFLANSFTCMVHQNFSPPKCSHVWWLKSTNKHTQEWTYITADCCRKWIIINVFLVTILYHAVYRHDRSTLSISSCLISSRNLVVRACWSDNPWAFSFWAFDNSSSSCILSCCKTAILFHSCSLTSCTLRSNSLFCV